MNNLKKTGIFSLLLIAIAMLSITSCKKDDDDINPDTGNAESAILYGFRTQTPSGVVYYMNVFPEIPANPSTSDAIELGAGWSNRIWSFGEHPYTWNGDASTLTKWNVSKTDLSLSVGDVMSFASTGLSGDFGPPAFLSETKAYFFALGEGKVVEFNPAEMTIVSIHDVDPLTFSGTANGAWYDVWDKYVINGKILMPVDFFAGSDWETPDGATVAVFDPSTNTISYNVDTRLMAGLSKFAIDENGNMFHAPAFDNPFAAHYGGQSNPLPTRTLLKVNDDGTYDPSFSLDLGDSLNATGINSVPLVFNNKAFVIYSAESDFQIPLNPEDRWNSYNLENVTKSTIDLTTGEIEPFTALDNYKLFNFHTTIDGVNYMWARNDIDDTQYSYILRQNAIDDYTEVSEFVGGQIRHVRKLW